jgi:hypothetical protein
MTSKPLVELVLDNKGIPVDVIVSSSDVFVVLRFKDEDRIFIPNLKVDLTLQKRYLQSPKLHGKL